MNIFNFRNKLIEHYSSYVRSFFEIKDPLILKQVEEQFETGLLWPDVLLQLNPSFEAGATTSGLIKEGLLHPKCEDIFQRRNEHGNALGPFTFHRHQVESIEAARSSKNYVLTTGTGSGKSLCYIVPIVDCVLRTGTGDGIKAIIVYPMNALANSQEGELQKFLDPFGTGESPVTFKRYTGQETESERAAILSHPPDFLLTNYVMLELILTRPRERRLVEKAANLKFLVLDELHTYRGRQGADVSMLVRRLKKRINSENLLCVGTSATMGGKPGEKKEEVVAKVSSLIFGQEVAPDSVIGETLIARCTPHEVSKDDLKAALTPLDLPEYKSIEEFCQHPLARWVEGTFGLRQDDEGKLERATPISIEGKDGAAQKLSNYTGVDPKVCSDAIKQTLNRGFECKIPATGKPLFAFRLHQFISRGGSVLSSLEAPDKRHITLKDQQFVPNDRSRKLYPLCFCRECGQDFVPVARHISSDVTRFSSRELRELKFEEDDQIQAGFLLLSPELQWPESEEDQHDYVPADWLEESRGRTRIKSARRDNLPEQLEVNGLGECCESKAGTPVTFLPAPFRFCPSCQVSYDFRQRSDISKLTSLGTEGRSTATTVLSLFSLLGLKEESNDLESRKLLSFTDNRQDAALQAGHYNDFIEVGLIRAALFTALQKAGSDGLSPSTLQTAVYDALGLDFEEYADDPGVKGNARRQRANTFREVLGYRLFRDLKRGWRVIMPNLEQVGLLKIAYLDLEELSEDQELWQEPLKDQDWCDGLQVLADARPEERALVCKTLFDFLRRGLAIKTKVLNTEHQLELKNRSFSQLKDPWALGDDELLETSCAAYPRSRNAREDSRDDLFLSPQSGFGQFLKRPTTFSNSNTSTLKQENVLAMIKQLLNASNRYGIVVRADHFEEQNEIAYQLEPDSMRWLAGDGQTPFHDIIRVPSPPSGGGKINQFFVKFYRELAKEALGTEAQDHTAQVKSTDRENREKRFRRGSLPADDEQPKGLPILYCSPTMELGIDIRELNVVNMRNVPPTPANYAQRSGRAGRSGSPAMVFTYCSTFSAHDQFFFTRPKQMVSGIVTAPRIEIANEDLIKAHLYAIWLAESGLDLQSNMADILSISGDKPSLKLLESVQEALSSKTAKDRTKTCGRAILQSLQDELKRSDWWDEEWISRTVDAIPIEFENACRRWRNLFSAAQRQIDESARIIRDGSRSSKEKSQAEGLQREARNQLDLLTQQGSGGSSQSDFYTYRYFASEGFLPGYNFPRLPLSAYIPGKRRKKDDYEYVSRSRFIAVSEFGPQTMIYHSGNKYQVTRCLIPVNEDGEAAGGLQKQLLKICPQCGFLHIGSRCETITNCDSCEAPLDRKRDNLFRMENVSATKRNRINSDEEERLRQGFEILSGVRWAERENGLSFSTGEVVASNQTPLFKIHFGNSATLWRINLGWRRRNAQDGEGFFIDAEIGRWQKNPGDDGDGNDPEMTRPERVIPYVEDRRNALTLTPHSPLSEGEMATLQAALKQGIQLEFQLEEMELAAEPLPSEQERNQILFYESAEGGAGVLRRLISEKDALARVAAKALEVCHYDNSGTDLRRAPGATEDCEAGCYQCLLSYSNQRDHEKIDRALVREILLALLSSTTETAEAPVTYGEHLQSLLNSCDSDLEREWLNFLAQNSLRLPSHAQHFFSEFKTRPDFFYEKESVVIYVDGHHHDLADRAQRDQEQEELLEAHGYRVVRFRYDEDWSSTVAKYSFVFGTLPNQSA